MEGLPYRVAQYFQPQIEADAIREAPWTDRTGNARQSLFGSAVPKPGGGAILALGHGMEYGPHLELKYQGRYAIIMPIMQRYYPRIKTVLRLRQR